MIRIDFSFFISFYVGGWFLVFFSFWLLQKIEFRSNIFTIEKKFIYRCKICTYTYFLSTYREISRCPLCGSLNKKEEG